MNLSISALESLFGSLLDISKLDAGTLQPDIRSIQINALLERLQDDYSHQAREKGLAFSCVVCDAVVLTDATMLERILRNLIINAIRYTDTGQIKLRCITLATALRIEVCDTGPGIAAHHLDEIFEEFTQLNNPERDRSKGIGLGLAIVKRTTELLNHKMDVSSEVDKGSVFAIEVPLGDPTSVSVSTPSKQKSSADLNNLYVILVDDERAVCEGMQVLLEGWGCRVASFTDAYEVLQQLSPQQPPDAIMVDYRLRCDKTGVEAIHTLNQFFNCEDIPALIITGDTAPDRLREAQASGYQLLHKPVAPAKLRAFLQSVQRTISTTGSEGLVS
jgi:CheY-like chemotaxis protein/anti-sigma regulatory factor (Ser/Thr protein kinase)